VKLIKIDVVKQDVYEVEHDDTLSSIYSLLECDTFCIGASFVNGDCIMVDDEGLLKDPIGYFQLKPGTQPLTGHGLVSSVDSHGDTKPPKSTIEQIRGICQFFKPGEILQPEPMVEVETYNSLDEMIEAQKDLAAGKGKIAEKFRKANIRKVPS